jgi:hypothetical protein
MAQAGQIQRRHPSMTMRPIKGDLEPTAEAICVGGMFDEHAVVGIGNFNAEFYWTA